MTSKATSSSIEHKLKKYSMIAAPLVAATAANSQIVYTDVNPDTTVTVGNNYELDMNADATSDFVLQVNAISGTFSGSYGTIWNYSGSGVFIGGGTGTNGWMGSGVAYSNVLNVNQGNPVGSSANFGTGTGLLGSSTYRYPTWNGNGYPSYATFVQGGNFLGETDAYIGLRFDIGGNTHYGWARLDVASDGSSFTLKDYAYNATAGDPINAGQMVGVHQEISRLVDIRNTPERVYAFISSELTNGTLSIQNTMGQTIASQAINGVKAEIGLEDLATGIYVVTAQFDEGTMTRKIFVR